MTNTEQLLRQLVLDCQADIAQHDDPEGSWTDLEAALVTRLRSVQTSQALAVTAGDEIPEPIVGQVWQAANITAPRRLVEMTDQTVTYVVQGVLHWETRKSWSAWVLYTGAMRC